MNAIYQDWFGLKQAPFAITPDPTFVYLSGGHQEALAHLLYGVGQGGGGGFVQLTGEVGTGKTTLCRCLLEQLDENTHIALILNPLLNSEELIEAILHELRLGDLLLSSHKQRLDHLNQYLLDAHAADERVVVIIDEAQNLPPETLEQLRLLTNLETNTDKLLQIILLGQPELRDLLARNDLRQLSQRITARFHLTPLNQNETAAYVKHRLAVASGSNSHNPFTNAALKTIYRASAGIPRLINTISDRAMLAAYSAEKTSIDSALVRAAAAEVSGQGQQWSLNKVMLPVGVILLLLLVGWYFRDLWLPQPEPVEPVTEVVEGQTEPPVKEIVAERELTAVDRYLANKQAWSGLASVWSTTDQASMVRASCTEQVVNGFACLQLQGSWGRIRDLGLPVLLELGGGESADLMLLTDLSSSTAQIYPLGEIALPQLDKDWRGRYLVVWPQDPDWPMTIHAATAEGELASRLKTMASKLTPSWQGEISEQADPQFGSWLRTFQRNWGLEDDGIIGPETLLYLIAPSLQPNLSVVSGEE